MELVCELEPEFFAVNALSTVKNKTFQREKNSLYKKFILHDTLHHLMLILLNVYFTAHFTL